MYMSPEQARGEAVDMRSDVYSLCVLFHELLGLKHYLDDCTSVETVLASVQHTSATPPTFIPNPHQSPAPADLSWFVRKGMDTDPSRRYQSVSEMIERLEAREEGIVPIECHVTLTKRATREWIRWVDRHPTLYTVLLGTFVLSSIVLGVWAAIHR
jgi:eukaryotic-like serine/threonine-protein kinase